MNASVADYAEHLTESDLRLLSAVTDGAPPALPGGAPPAPGGAKPGLAGDGSAIEALLADPRVFEAVFGRASVTAGQAVLVSPFLAFGVAVHRAVADLSDVDYLPERSGRQRVPLFDAPQLRDFLGSAARRLFLAELLASFTRNAAAYRPAPKGQPGTRQARQARARRISELDLVRMAGLLDTVPEAERAGVYRRLGDVALFLTGVFPDYAAAHALGPVSAAQLLRAAQVPAQRRDQLADAPAIDLFEHLGAQWYRAAWGMAPTRTGRLAVVADVAERFRQARRVLNHIADRCLFP